MCGNFSEGISKYKQFLRRSLSLEESLEKGIPEGMIVKESLCKSSLCEGISVCRASVMESLITSNVYGESL